MTALPQLAARAEALGWELTTATITIYGGDCDIVRLWAADDLLNFQRDTDAEMERLEAMIAAEERRLMEVAHATK